MASQVPYSPVPTEAPQLDPLPQAHVDTPGIAQVLHLGVGTIESLHAALANSLEVVYITLVSINPSLPLELVILKIPL